MLSIKNSCTILVLLLSCYRGLYIVRDEKSGIYARAIWTFKILKYFIT